MLSLTLRNAYYPTLSFLIMFFIIFVGCGQAFNMTFGPYLDSYSDVRAIERASTTTELRPAPPQLLFYSVL